MGVVLVSYPVSALLVAVVAPFGGGTPTPTSLVWGGLAGITGGCAVLWFYAALAIGPMSVVSPVTALLTAAVPLLGGLLFGERPTPWALLGAVLAIGAVVLVSRGERSAVDEGAPVRVTPRVLLFSVGAGMMFALYFVLLDRVPPETGVWPVVVSRGSASVVVVAAAAILRRLRPATGRPGFYATSAGVIDVAASVAMLFALQAGMLSLVSVIASLYPAVTVLMARIVIGERSGPGQKVGLVLAAVSVTLIAASG
jgi:drug/metabolite transporter (DMT)-like permease